MLHSDAIHRAEEQIERNRHRSDRDPHRLGYHFMVPAGWINDPNGLIQFAGRYHLFYQHNPYGIGWGPMHWGHAVSDDLLRWERLPVALAPTEPYEHPQPGGGCFSGSAVDDNGVLTLIYTGCSKDRRPPQVQCIATSTDGVTFRKHPDNPVIAAPPPDGSDDFRDPKVWRHGDDWFMVVGSCRDGRGKALIYRSPDLRRWDYLGVALESGGTQGTMWECPDLFPLGDRHVLIVSPIGAEGARTLCFVGDFDYGTGRFAPDSCRALDPGVDFYAPQSFQDAAGRRIQIGWVHSWTEPPAPTADHGWMGAHSLPRRLSIGPDGGLLVWPVAEAATLRGSPVRRRDVVLSPDVQNPLAGLRGDLLEIEAGFDLSGCTASAVGLSVRRSEDGSRATQVVYHPADGRLELDRRRADATHDDVCAVDCPADATLRLRVFVDRSMVEIFAADGRVAIADRIYPDPANRGVEAFAEGGSVRLTSLTAWPLADVALPHP